MKPPGIPDWASRKRIVPPGLIPIEGRAWSGGGKQITKVEVLLDGDWLEAELESQVSRYAWTKWKINWLAAPGYHILSCRATDEHGDVQPESPKPNVGGFENNAIQKIEVFVKDF